IWVLGDQLWLEQAALQSCVAQKSHTPVILIESAQSARARSYHRQKLVLVWSAMRHFAAQLRQAGWSVTYDMAENFATPLQSWVRTHQITELRVMTPNNHPFAQFIDSLDLPCQINKLPNNHFLWTETQFRDWAQGRKTLLMEPFYREGRRRFQVLMAGKKPIGGQWNFDRANRNPPKKNLNPPAALWFEPDETTQSVMDWVQSQSFSTYGDLASFRWAVTREQALQVLHHFINHRLPTFGPYQDAMVTGEETLWHALLSPYLNLGLLQPMEIIQAAEQAYWDKCLELNSVEGFIRQVLGWREYMHGLYTYVTSASTTSASVAYGERNWFKHTHPLPGFFWTGKTDMNCLHQVLDQVQHTGYAHHIQRLMVLSNFALIAGLSPQAVENWFHAAFIDAYDWVMQTNVMGMGLFADGGLLASKPYAASANYIKRMSDYCKHCRYDAKARIGENACPFNFFYWDFLDRHQHQLQSQGRMSFILKNLDKMSDAELAQIRRQAADWLEAEVTSKEEHTSRD
ncbi:MAG: cryptochrome/photolyase family protein, partial [Cyanothece sp. SIO1E1]|nr:cryptochrome/photolyase family protein [Cyanothece sp. SIO1E1]